MLEMSFRMWAVWKERLSCEEEDSQTDIGQVSPWKRFPAGCTEPKSTPHSEHSMLSLAAAGMGIMQVQISSSPRAGTSCHPSRVLQVDGEQQKVQGAWRRERELLSVGATQVLSGGKKNKNDWQSCSSESLFRQCHICKSVTNYAWLCLKAAEMLSSVSREMGFLSIAIKISSFSAVDSLIATSGWWRVLWSAATVLLTRAGASLQIREKIHTNGSSETVLD